MLPVLPTLALWFAIANAVWSWDAVLNVVKDHAHDQVLTVTVLAGWKLVVTTGADKSMCQWSLGNLESKACSQLNSVVLVTAGSTGLLFTGDNLGVLQRWNLNGSGILEPNVFNSYRPSIPVTALNINMTLNKLFVGYANGAVRQFDLWNLAQEEVVYTGGVSSVLSLDVLPKSTGDFSLIATFSTSQVLVWLPAYPNFPFISGPSPFPSAPFTTSNNETHVFLYHASMDCDVGWMNANGVIQTAALQAQFFTPRSPGAVAVSEAGVALEPRITVNGSLLSATAHSNGTVTFWNQVMSSSIFLTLVGSVSGAFSTQGSALDYYLDPSGSLQIYIGSQGGSLAAWSYNPTGAVALTSSIIFPTTSSNTLTPISSSTTPTRTSTSTSSRASTSTIGFTIAASSTSATSVGSLGTVTLQFNSANLPTRSATSVSLIPSPAVVSRQITDSQGRSSSLTVTSRYAAASQDSSTTRTMLFPTSTSLSYVTSFNERALEALTDDGSLITSTSMLESINSLLPTPTPHFGTPLTSQPPGTVVTEQSPALSPTNIELARQDEEKLAGGTAYIVAAVGTAGVLAIIVGGAVYVRTQAERRHRASNTDQLFESVDMSSAADIMRANR